MHTKQMSLPLIGSIRIKLGQIFSTRACFIHDNPTHGPECRMMSGWGGQLINLFSRLENHLQYDIWVLFSSRAQHQIMRQKRSQRGFNCFTNIYYRLNLCEQLFYHVWDYGWELSTGHPGDGETLWKSAGKELQQNLFLHSFLHFIST